jgi:competence protein ComEA
MTFTYHLAGWHKARSLARQDAASTRARGPAGGESTDDTTPWIDGTTHEAHESINQRQMHDTQRRGEMTMTRTIMTIALAALLAGEVLAAAPAASATPKVNINSASVEQLQLLPRVGPALAQRIVEFREANGPFKSAAELIRVRGIGEKSFESLKPYLATDGETTLKEKVKSPRKPKGEPSR